MSASGLIRLNYVLYHPKVRLLLLGRLLYQAGLWWVGT